MLQGALADPPCQIILTLGDDTRGAWTFERIPDRHRIMCWVYNDRRSFGDLLHHVPPRQVTLNSADALLHVGAALLFLDFFAHLLVGHAELTSVPAPGPDEVNDA